MKTKKPEKEETTMTTTKEKTKKTAAVMFDIPSASCRLPPRRACRWFYRCNTVLVADASTIAPTDRGVGTYGDAQAIARHWRAKVASPPWKTLFATVAQTLNGRLLCHLRGGLHLRGWGFFAR